MVHKALLIRLKCCEKHTNSQEALRNWTKVDAIRGAQKVPPTYEVFTWCGDLEDSSPSHAKARTTPASWCWLSWKQQIRYHVLMIKPVWRFQTPRPPTAPTTNTQSALSSGQAPKGTQQRHQRPKLPRTQSSGTLQRRTHATLSSTKPLYMPKYPTSSLLTHCPKRWLQHDTVGQSSLLPHNNASGDVNGDVIAISLHRLLVWHNVYCPTNGRLKNTDIV